MRSGGVLTVLGLLLVGCGQGSGGGALPPLPSDPAVNAELRNIFDAHDANKDGVFTPAESDSFLQNSFLGADVTENNRIGPREWKGFSFLASVANQNGRFAEFEEAKTAVFKRLDADGDGFLTPSEIRTGARREFSDADQGNQGGVSTTYDEFTRTRSVRELAAASAKS